MKLSHFLSVLAIALALSGCATTTSPTGRTQYVGAVSQDQLNQLGLQAFDEQKKNLPQSNDAARVALVRCVVNALVARLPPEQQQLGWEVAVFVDTETNAYALPGGKVGVYTGIFKVAKNQDQLAGVLAHEIAHVTSRHHDERMTRQYGAQGAMQVVGSLLGAYYGGNVGSLATQGGSLLVQTGFLLPGTRAQEDEADIVGQQLMADAGFDPRGAVQLWQNMAAAGGDHPPEFLSTHPDPQARIGQMQRRAGDLIPVYEQAQAAGRRPACDRR